MTLPNRVAYSSMETTTKKTCKQLYEWHPAFRGMVDGWGLHRWCPVEMFDLLTEEGMDDGADCAKWCYEQPERGSSELLESRVYPKVHRNSRHCWWFVGNLNEFNVLPAEHFSQKSADSLYRDQEDVKGAILALLDAWRIA